MTSQSLPTTPTPSADRIRALAAPALAGALAAGIAIAISELFAGFIAGAPSLVTAIGQLVIDLQPPGAKDFMVNLFGTNDKLALTVFIVVVALVIAAAVGVAGARSIRRADVAFGVFGLVGLFAASRQALVSLPLAVVTTIVAVVGGLWVLRELLSPVALTAASAEPAERKSRARTKATPVAPTWDRRRFLHQAARRSPVPRSWPVGSAAISSRTGRQQPRRSPLCRSPPRPWCR
jgi:hypothetical protein